MRRLSKSKKGKANASASEKDAAQEAEVQDNGSAVPNDEEDSGNEKRAAATPKSKRGRSGVSYEAEGDADDSASASQKLKKVRKGRKNNRENGNESDEEGSKVEAGSEEEEEDASASAKVNKGKKDRKGGKDDADQAEEKDEEEEYEVEKIVDCKIYRGVKQYRIRWKGFKEDKDTWESEADLNCSELIDQFLSKNPDAAKLQKPAKTEKKSGNDKKRKSANTGEPKAKQQRVVEPIAEEGGEKVYEVERVLEVYFKKNGEREFLIRWKGFSADDDTWEPESNLNCPELIEKFMEKVEKAKELSERELRVNPQSTKRFTLNTRDTGRRLSGRHQSRQRVTYYDAE